MRALVALVCTICLSGCFSSFAKPKLTPHVPRASCPRYSASTYTSESGSDTSQAPRKLAVFFDGTSNDEGSYTNVSKLYNLVTLQSRCDISTLYVNGVGTDDGLLASFTGMGIGNRVKAAYGWLSSNYDPARHDSILVFGFSRGAYSARILAAMLYAAGLPDLRAVPKSTVTHGVGQIYKAYKGRFDSLAIRKRVAEKAVLSLGWQPRQVTVAFMGLFETVEALGPGVNFRQRLRPTNEDVEDRNRKYGDQLCNVGKAAHAMSLDDNRAFIFTPKLLTRDFLISQCERGSVIDLDKIVNEVWFSGAHSDVGGQTKTLLDDVPLNWMLQQLAPFNLVSQPQVYADPFDVTNNPRASRTYRFLYGYRKRNLASYIDQNRTQYNRDSTTNLPKLKIHDSAIRRIENESLKKEFWWNEWYKTNADRQFTSCFAIQPRETATSIKTRNDSILKFVGGRDCRVDRVK